MKNTIKIWLIFTLFSLIFQLAVAQPTGDDIVIGQSFTMHSNVLDEERPYFIYLPQDYDPEGDPVSVMYLLDGGGHFHHTTGVVSFLKNQGRIPNMMVLGIPNTKDRTRDLTPKIEKDFKAAMQMQTAGGADNMLAFIKDELIPHIDQTYNTGSYKILTGHSFGGLFAVHSLLSEPDLFDAYISISPSMWWDNQNLVAKADTFLNSKPKLDCFFYMTMGDEGGTMLGGAMKLAALFEESDDEDFKWDFKVMDEETHGSIPHRSTYYGLEAIFKDWFTVDYEKLYTGGGLNNIDQFFGRISDKLGYAYSPSERALNNLGYEVMGAGKTDDALDIFLKNIELYPDSYNVYDSAGEAYMEDGQNQKAIEYYKLSMKLNPGNKNGVTMLDKLGVTYDPMEFAIELSNHEKESYVGKYEVSTGGHLTIKIEDEQLIASHPAIPNQKLIAYSNDMFMFLPNNIPVRFIVDDQDRPTGFSAEMGIGMVVQGKKVKEGEKEGDE